jgi:selenocysteine lyase/cysteine desulfurase
MAVAALKQILSWTVPVIQQRISLLTDRAAQLAAESGYIVQPPDRRLGHMIGIRLPGGLPGGLAATLAAARIYVSIRGDAIRVAPHLYNTPSDIDRLFEVLRRTR